MTDFFKKMRSPSARNGNALPVEIPVPESIESNDDEAWALWEDSVAFQDSQYPDDSHGVTVKGETEAPPAPPANETDAFAAVTKNRD